MELVGVSLRLCFTIGTGITFSIVVTKLAVFASDMIQKSKLHGIRQ